MLRSNAAAAFLVLTQAFAPLAAAGPARQDDAPQPGDITTYTVGRAEGIAESSYIHQPQIERLMTDPYPQIVPIQKLPIPEGQKPEERGFRPRPRQYVPFDGVGFTGWVPPDCTLAVGSNHVL